MDNGAVCRLFGVSVPGHSIWYRLHGTRMLREVVHMLKLRGAQTVVVGIQPDVAFAMVQLGLTLEGVGTALDLEEGLAYLDQLTAKNRKNAD